MKQITKNNESYHILQKNTNNKQINIITGIAAKVELHIINITSPKIS